MAKIEIEIKDAFVIPMAKKFGFSYPEDQVPPFEEHLTLIKSRLNGLIDPHYKDIIQESDLAIIQKKSELNSLIESKLIEAKPVESEVKSI